MQTKRFVYQQQDAVMTVREGLAEYFAGHPELLHDAQLGGTEKALFHAHDLCHVVFGLDTTLIDEGLVDLWTMLASDVGVMRYLRYLMQSPNAVNIFKSVRWWQYVIDVISSLPRMCLAIVSALRVKRKWPWDANEALLDKPLGELRREFGIRLV